MAQTVITEQVAPSATTETDLYTVSSGAYFIGSSIMICNRDSSPTTARVSIAVGGGATANKDYIYKDLPIAGNDTFGATIGITMNDGDVMRVYAGNANLSFSLFGMETT